MAFCRNRSCARCIGERQYCDAHCEAAYLHHERGIQTTLVHVEGRPICIDNGWFLIGNHRQSWFDHVADGVKYAFQCEMFSRLRLYWFPDREVVEVTDTDEIAARFAAKELFYVADTGFLRLGKKKVGSRGPIQVCRWHNVTPAIMPVSN